jgi:hypothetical protein
MPCQVRRQEKEKIMDTLAVLRVIRNHVPELPVAEAFSVADALHHLVPTSEDAERERHKYARLSAEAAVWAYRNLNQRELSRYKIRSIKRLMAQFPGLKLRMAKEIVEMATEDAVPPRDLDEPPF